MLREKIREHALAMQSRRQKPYGNPLEDMKAAQRELEEVNYIHRLGEHVQLLRIISENVSIS